MNLEDVIKHSTKHNHNYHKIANSPMQSIKQLAQAPNSPIYIIDTCILLNPQNTFSQITTNLDENKRKLTRVIPQLIKNVYGQTKYITELQNNGQLQTTEHIIEEFNDNYKQFNKIQDSMLHSLHNSENLTPQIEHYISEISEQMDTINQNLPNIQFEDTNLINQMIKQFKESKFYTKRLNFPTKHHTIRNKKISDEDLSLLMLGAHIKTKNPNTQTSIVTGDRVLLGQGSVIFNNELYKSPQILLSQCNKKYGTMFQYGFEQFTQPRLNPNRLENITKKEF